LRACENRVCLSLGFFRFRFHHRGRPFEFVYSGYSQSRSAFPLYAIKNPPKRFAWRAFKVSSCFLHLSDTHSLRIAKTILAAFSNALNKHMFACVHHFVSLCPLLRYILVIHCYLVLVNCFIYLFESFLTERRK
jgi:hypothetical protein